MYRSERQLEGGVRFMVCENCAGCQNLFAELTCSSITVVHQYVEQVHNDAIRHYSR
jgi:hypothetical protein